jgi:endonuclease/exonuclease/phosphatase family metal-dependent hydrolase
MNYLEKYLKYKNKYLNLKNQKGGSNPLFNDKPGVLLNKSEFEKFDEENQKKYDFYCPDEKPYLCTVNSNSLGLCKDNDDDCNDIDKEGVQPIIVGEKSTAGQQHGYDPANLHNRCVELYKDYELEDVGQSLPEKFKVATYNIWGLYRKKTPKKDEENNKYDELNSFVEETIKIRMKHISEEILRSKPDVVCFQEMSDIAYGILNEKIGSIYKYKYEKNFDQTNRDYKKRNRDVEVYIFSKYPVKKVTVYGLKGNLHYTDSMMVAEFNNAVIFNCYLQAGSKKSPGQEKYWYHYSRCREDQLNQIKKLISKYLEEDYKKPIIVVGDFNFHLDGPIEEWNEFKVIKDYLEDSWRTLYNDDQGYTENTDINKMRWNLKFQEKKLRYDGILYKNLKPIESIIIGNTPIRLNDTLTELFKKYWLSKDSTGRLLNEDKIKYASDGKSLELFPSDHFGVVTTFSF